MQPAIDSYSYHRFFGDWYAGLQADPGVRITVFDFLDRACVHGVAGVSLESCFVPHDERFIEELREALDARRLDRVWAWGHPNGLGSGTDRGAAADLVNHLAIARRLGARVMRICGGGRRTRPSSWARHKGGLMELLHPCVEQAERHGVVLAIENHIDLLADEMVELVASIDSPWLGVCFDTANNLRMFEDPVDVARKLAPFTRATHIKDVTAQRGDPRSFAFWPSVPLGQGLVDLRAILRLLHEARYGGLLALEIDYLAPAFAPEGEEACVAASIAWLRDELAALRVSVVPP